MKKIWFENSRGQKLAGMLHEANQSPKASEDAFQPTRKAVIMAHGFKADKDEVGIFTRTAEALCKNGFTVLRFDFAGSGESEGEFVEMTLSSEVEDLKSAIGFMKGRVYRIIGLVGASFGGTVSILGVSKDIKALVLWNPKTRKGGFSSLGRSDKNWRGTLDVKGYFELYGQNTKRFYRVGRPLISELDSIDVFYEAKKIKVPTLILHGRQDTHVPIEDSMELMKFLGKPKKLEIMKGAEHGFHDPDSERIAIRLTLEWFRKYL